LIVKVKLDLISR